MRIPRIFCSEELKVNHTIELKDAAANHVMNVLRMQLNDPLIIFNGKGGEYAGRITDISRRKSPSVYLEKFDDREVESPLTIHLAQVISRGDKMDFTLQKAVELGVSVITPLLSERCNVQLSGERLAKKIEHWQNVIISACEQCGRNTLPELAPVQSLSAWLVQSDNHLKIVFSPEAALSLSDLKVQQIKAVTLLIGPEGGLTESEIRHAEKSDFKILKLGPRILRTETAGLVAISLVQGYWGDFS